MQSGIELSLEKLHVKIGGMQCSFCTETIKQALYRINGIYDVSVSLAHEEALIQYDPTTVSSLKIENTLRSLGFKIRDPNKIRSFEEEEKDLHNEFIRLVITGILTFISLGLMIVMWLGFRFIWIPWFMLILAVFTMFGPGWYIKRMAWASLRRGILNQHVLLEFAAFGGLIGGIYGFFYQPWPMVDFLTVAVFVTSYHILSGYVSLLVRTRSSLAIKKLMALQPTTARIISKEKIEKEIPIEEVKPGDFVRVRSGESIPVDGIIVKGTSTVDQSIVTGEYIPILKKKGDEVIGGSINQRGTLIIEVTKVGKEAFLQLIAQHIQEARALKPGIVILIDHVLKYFIKAVLLAALFAFFLWTLGLWLITGQIDLSRAIFATLSVLIMGYPCALGMATPLALINGGGKAAQKGILMRSGESFQSFKDVKKVVLDKTGTLTVGKPQVVLIEPIDTYDDMKLLKIAASVEIGSEHPIGKALIDYSLAKEIALYEIDNFQEITGLGVQGYIQNKIVFAGNSRLFIQENINFDGYRTRINKLENQGLTVINIAEDSKYIGLIALGDTLKHDAKETIELLKLEGFEPIMISGDNWRVSRTFAKKLGIKKVFAEVLPQEKSAKIRKLQSKGYKVAMVGDGINDAPALMQADVGIAIGAGTDIAIESADIILLGDNLKAIIDAYQISRSSYKKTVQNIILAFLFNSIGVILAVAGILHPIWAMIAMALSVSIILMNSFGKKLLFKNKQSNNNAFNHLHH